MQALLRKSDEKHDLTCDVCGQGFLLYWSRPSSSEQQSMRATVQDELRQHHFGVPADLSPAAHPASPFNVPSWEGSPQFSGAALLGGLSTIRRTAPPELDFSAKQS
jgi:hypothetical protein